MKPRALGLVAPPGTDATLKGTKYKGLRHPLGFPGMGLWREGPKGASGSHRHVETPSLPARTKPGSPAPPDPRPPLCPVPFHSLPSQPYHV